MSQLRGIDADFTSFRHVQGRKVIQLTFEVPIERTAEVFNMLGSPTSGQSLWCAIAPLNMKAIQAEPSSSEPKANGSPKKFHELPLPQQAAIRCQDKDFHWFLMDNYPAIAATNETAKGVVCVVCGVNSRSEIVHGEASGDSWHNIETLYQAWLTDRKFAEARR